jgi:hypothetical protein
MNAAETFTETQAEAYRDKLLLICESGEAFAEGGGDCEGVAAWQSRGLQVIDGRADENFRVFLLRYVDVRMVGLGYADEEARFLRFCRHLADGTLPGVLVSQAAAETALAGSCR